MKKIIVGLISIIVLAVIVNTVMPSSTPSKVLPNISYQETFSQTEDEYFVYFYQDSCGLCQEFKPELIDVSAKHNIPVYMVDLGDEANKSAWYDWETHDKTYPKVIGTVVDGEKVFNEGESEANYPTNEGWEITTNENNEILADHKGAFNNLTPQTPEELDISGTPSLLKVKNGKFADYAEGLSASRTLLNNYIEAK